jgi:hypothetical protein
MNEEHYCISMRDVQRRKERHTCPLILLSEVNDTPVLANSIDEAVSLARAYKEWHPEITFEIFAYRGRSMFAYQEDQYGTWMIGREVLATV